MSGHPVRNCYHRGQSRQSVFACALWPVQTFHWRTRAAHLERQWKTYGYGSIPISTIFSGMNIHLPAILMFTRGTRFWPTAICWSLVNETWQQLQLVYGPFLTLLWVGDAFLSINGALVKLKFLGELPSGKRLHSDGKPPFLMGKLTINGHFQ